jgi:3-mercaptopyruvate sulfurtransferase SseA
MENTSPLSHSPISICEPSELCAMLLQKSSSEINRSKKLVVIDAISSAIFPRTTIPTAVCVRMDAFDIYLYENDAIGSGGDTTDNSDSEQSSSNCRENDDPSDSGITNPINKNQNKQTNATTTATGTTHLPVMTYGNFNLRPPKELLLAVEALQITRETCVVVLTQNYKMGAADPITAARLAWLLCYCGVLDVRILNGGFGAWQLANNDVVPVTKVEDYTTLLADDVPRVDFFNGRNDLPFPSRPDYLAKTEDVMAIVKNRVDGVLADVRSWDEYIGKMHGYNFDLGCGRIPGARWAHWGPSTYRGGDFSMQDEIGKLQNLESINKFWKEWEIILENNSKNTTEERVIIFYCGSGWRSAMAWVMSQLLGLKNCKSYDGSFLEWNKLHPNSNNHQVDHGLPINMPLIEKVVVEETKLN